jgi:DNA-directed RNA polymerase specialized sigma24 family protein
MSDMTVLLAAARQGDQQAVGQLLHLLYDDLHRLTRSRLREHRTMPLLDTTSLLHESFLKLIGASVLPVEDRRHLFRLRCQRHALGDRGLRPGSQG